MVAKMANVKEATTIPTTLDITSKSEIAKPKKYISIHSDLDGFVSGILYLKSHPEEELEVYIAETFGETRDNIAVMVDQRPIDAKWAGLCIDHHDDHPKEHAYTLIGDNHKPATTLIIYEQYKDKIPKEELWKVALGMYGDGADQHTPDEVWLSYPDLLNTSGYPKESYGQTKIFPVAIYKICGSLINFARRIGSPKEAFGLLCDARNPWEIVANKYLRSARKRTTDAMTKTVKEETFPIDLGRKVYWEYNADVALWMAQIAYESTGKTAIALNKANKHVSIRGPIAKYIADELKKRGIDAGGHPGFCGAIVTEEQEDKLLDYLKEMEL